MVTSDVGAFQDGVCCDVISATRASEMNSAGAWSVLGRFLGFVQKFSDKKETRKVSSGLGFRDVGCY